LKLQRTETASKEFEIRWHAISYIAIHRLLAGENTRVTNRTVNTMKKIEAIIRHHKLDDVRTALVTLGVHGITVSEVRGSGHTPSHTEVYRGQEYAVDFTPRVKVEVAVTNADCAETVRTIVKAARTGEVGDGCVLVLPLNDAVRVRTGETGDDAL